MAAFNAKVVQLLYHTSYLTETWYTLKRLTYSLRHLGPLLFLYCVCQSFSSAGDISEAQNCHHYAKPTTLLTPRYSSNALDTVKIPFVVDTAQANVVRLMR